MSDNKAIEVKEKEAIKKEDGEPTREGVYYTPAVDIFETEEAITLLAELPGVSKEALDIDVEDRQLTITAGVKEDEAGLQPLYTEYGIGGFTRSFRLGDTIDQGRISATLTDGVLTLVLPKAERLKPRKIEIATA